MPYWEEFEVRVTEGMNVIGALKEIRKNPVTVDGKKTTPPVWDESCLEEICGACTMLINGRPRQACAALIDTLGDKIVLEPLSKFPVIRDLWVDRTKMFDALKRVRAWVENDGYFDLGPGPFFNEKERKIAYAFSRCMTCGCCVEACPQYNARSPFIGAHALGQVYLFNMLPLGKKDKDERLDAIMGVGGISECGNAQNCVEVCPKNIPLTDAIASLGWATTVRAIKRLLTE
jgi:succinate dehydrogenase / fumarate reductase iron-sulfur subunit